MTGNNNTTSKRPRFSVIDFVIILMVFACFTGIAMRYNIAGKLFNKTQLNETEISFVCEKLTLEEAKAFSEGTVFYAGNATFGSVKFASQSSAVYYIENSSGVLVAYENPDKADIRGTFTCSAVKSDNGYLLNGKTYIAAGSVFTIAASGVSVEMTVTGISEVSK